MFLFNSFVKFTKHKSPAMQILQSFKLVTYFQRFVINSPQNTDKFWSRENRGVLFLVWNRKKIFKMMLSFFVFSISVL